ncbi:hypothetical protein B0H17DRAFT_23310 [Mycena rosella]|uniref:Structure-specific endonuclease subunit SLX4 n=1 Tax=Mycena rosella TaxID=1033263 RepID=A0AAD7GAT2_MYCRO|nr:hypothetical protein B0H17DRAFT_23310 [Mycena rosella]
MHPLDLPAMAGPSTVIEISDGSVPASPVASSSRPTLPPTSNISVIEISDSSASMSEPLNILKKDVVSMDSSRHVGDATDQGCRATCYVQFRRRRPRNDPNAKSTAGSRSSSDTQAKALPKPVARGSSNSLAGDFPDAELKKLDKCVSCDIAWTARKSGAQKLVHIRSCAKKNGLTDDTLRILIRREIDNAPNDAGPSKRKGKAPVDTPTTPTLLEDVVREAAPKRKGKRKEPVDALKSVSETRETILGRARILLDSGPLSDEHSFAVRTQAFTSTLPTAAPEPTQAFGVSRLGQRQGSKVSVLGQQDSDSDAEPELPPATQAFAPSKLGARLGAGASRGWGYESESERESAASGSDLNVSSARKSTKRSSSSAKEVSSRKAKGNKSAAVIPPATQLGSDDWDNDDAYVHFDPDLELNKEPVAENIVPTKKPKQRTKSKSPKSKRKAKNDDPAVPATPKKSRKKAADEYDEAWELGLKDKITNDRDLHLRILRYEPINFEVFVQLATEDGEVAGGRLKFKLRVFLDKQAINFYGGEAGRVGRR